MYVWNIFRYKVSKMKLKQNVSTLIKKMPLMKYNSGRLPEKGTTVPKRVGVLYLLLIVFYDLYFILFRLVYLLFKF
jgi:hypothetical protein